MSQPEDRIRRIVSILEQKGHDKTRFLKLLERVLEERGTEELNELLNILDRKEPLPSFIKPSFEEDPKDPQKMKEEVVGYDAEGSPINKEDLKKRAKTASGRVKGGDYVDQKDVERGGPEE